jgi:hypothetical protein
MRVLSYGGERDVSFLKIGQRMWPVSQNLIPATFFYAALDVSKTFTKDGDNSQQIIVVYESPDVYWQIRVEKPHLDDFRDEEDPQDAFDTALAKYVEDLTEFRERNRDWFMKRAEMLEDMPGYIQNQRERTGARETYPADGYEARQLNGVFETDSHKLY